MFGHAPEVRPRRLLCRQRRAGFGEERLVDTLPERQLRDDDVTCRVEEID